MYDFTLNSKFCYTTKQIMPSWLSEQAEKKEF